MEDERTVMRERRGGTQLTGKADAIKSSESEQTDSVRIISTAEWFALQFSRPALSHMPLIFPLNHSLTHSRSKLAFSIYSPLSWPFTRASSSRFALIFHRWQNCTNLPQVGLGSSTTVCVCLREACPRRVYVELLKASLWQTREWCFHLFSSPLMSVHGPTAAPEHLTFSPRVGHLKKYGNWQWGRIL